MSEQRETIEADPRRGTSDSFQQWCIVELMGHVCMAGLVTEEARFGTKLGRVDIPRLSGSFSTHYFGGGSVYRLTPTTEEIARAVAYRSTLSTVRRTDAGTGLTDRGEV